MAAELAPQNHQPEILLAAARFEREIEQLSDDVFRQAEIYFSRGRMFALYGKHEEAIADFDEAKMRIDLEENSEMNMMILGQINSHRRDSLRILGYDIEA